MATRAALSTPPIKHDHYVLSVSVSQDGALLASSGPERAIRLWDLSKVLAAVRHTSRMSLAQIKQDIDRTANVSVSPAGDMANTMKR